jgi:transketolase C-terminal domain/subunit
MYCYTAEEHNILGGLGESISRVLALNKPAPQEFVAVNDSFGESGTCSINGKIQVKQSSDC